MSSMDFIYDIKEKLDEEKLDYAICVMKPAANGHTKVEVFYNVEDDDSYHSMCDAFKMICGGEPDGDVDIEYDSDALDPEPTPTNET